MELGDFQRRMFVKYHVGSLVDLARSMRDEYEQLKKTEEYDPAADQMPELWPAHAMAAGRS